MRVKNDTGLKEYYTHINCKLGWYTVCDLLDGDAIVAQGISICSPRDNYDRKKGNLIALGRALKAYREKRNISIINHDRDAVRENFALQRVVETTEYKVLYYETNYIKV